MHLRRATLIKGLVQELGHGLLLSFPPSHARSVLRIAKQAINLTVLEVVEQDRHTGRRVAQQHLRVDDLGELCRAADREDRNADPPQLVAEKSLKNVLVRVTLDEQVDRIACEQL